MIVSVIVMLKHTTVFVFGRCSISLWSFASIKHFLFFSFHALARQGDRRFR